MKLKHQIINVERIQGITSSVYVIDRNALFLQDSLKFDKSNTTVIKKDKFVETKVTFVDFTLLNPAFFLYIQIRIYNISYILAYYLIITIRHYRDDAKRSEITRLPHGYMKQNEDNTRKLYTKKQRVDEKHRRTTYYK